MESCQHGRIRQQAPANTPHSDSPALSTYSCCFFSGSERQGCQGNYCEVRDGFKAGAKVMDMSCGDEEKDLGELELCSGLGHWKSSQAHMHIFRQSKLDNDSMHSLSSQNIPPKCSKKNTARFTMWATIVGRYFAIAVIVYPHKSNFREKRFSFGL